jgi:peptidoglycan/xylan/chitin deacetylase (PgdA/CDA1 family)
MEWTEQAARIVAASGASALAVGGALFAAHWPASRLYGSALIAPARPEQIALTFDDGPNPRWTPMLLEILARHNARATFFLLGKYAVLQKPLVRRMQAAGHRIANHSWSHPNFAFTGNRQTHAELTRTQQELESILGEPACFFRPPFGARRPYTLRCARSLGLTPVLWNAMAADWKATTVDQVAPRLAALIERNHARGVASNVVLHDGGQHSLDVDRSASVAAVEALLARFNATRRFVTLDAWIPASES